VCCKTTSIKHKKTKQKDKLPAVFLNEYEAEGTIIDRDNFRDFIFPVET
jgi:hypothetical protein